MKTRAQPHGVILEPFNGLSVALALQCGFVARGYSGNLDQLSGLIQEAIAHNGFSLVDILQPCVSYNHINTYQFYNDRVYDLAEHNHDSSDYAAACQKAREWGDRIPTGILYKKKSDSFTDKIPSLQQGPLIDRDYNKQKLDAILNQL
jgi:2-oxoglutarate ferredoxin oxidoreductase subunit beta